MLNLRRPTSHSRSVRRVSPQAQTVTKSVVLAVATATVLATGCASATPVGGPGSSGPQSVADTNDGTAQGSDARLMGQQTRWLVKTSEHIDLWIHAFAMLSTDSTNVPLYRRGYRDSLTVVKNSANVLTALDANRVQLASGLASSNRYLQAQFLPLDVANWDVLKSFAEKFLLYEGDPKRASDQSTALRVAQFASIFPSAADREWLRLFIVGVSDEQTRFFNDEHSRVVRERVHVITAVDTMWQNTYRKKFERFLTNTGQRSGDIILSIPIGGEGRTGVGRDRQTVVVVPFPQRVEDAAEVLYVFAHEVTGSLVGSVVADNTTPAEQRVGAADRMVASGQVRAGALLLQNIAPELLVPYMRFYIIQTGVAAPATLARTQLDALFAKQFELPVSIVTALGRQIDIVLGGI